MQSAHASTEQNKPPRTLGEAKQVIQDLRVKLGINGGAGTAAKPGGSPKPGNPTGPRSPIQPTGPQPKGPIPIRPRNGPDPGLSTALGDMVPTALTMFLSAQTDRQLKQLLSTETGKPRELKSDSVVTQIYREIKRRGNHAK